MKTMLSKVNTKDGDVTVMTKAGFLVSPRTTDMPSRFGDLGKLGVRFFWDTGDPGLLELMHIGLIQAFQGGTTLTELRQLANLGEKRLLFSLPFFGEDVTLPDSLIQAGNHIKRVM